jgi:hypothetical protein
VQKTCTCPTANGAELRGKQFQQPTFNALIIHHHHHLPCPGTTCSASPAEVLEKNKKRQLKHTLIYLPMEDPSIRKPSLAAQARLLETPSLRGVFVVRVVVEGASLWRD